MTFHSGSDYLWEIVELIADTIIAGYASWSDGDVTWTTTDTSDNNARRCLYHTDGIYIGLTCINTSTAVGSSIYSKGIYITISDAWSGNEPSGNIQSSFIQFESHTTTVSADLATLQIAYYLWINDNGFVILATPEAHSTDNSQGAFILSLERNTNKIYTDSYSNFFCYNYCAYRNQSSYSDWRSTNNVMRFYNFETNGKNNGYENTYFPNLNAGDNKVYYAFPYIHNAIDNTEHIYQPELFLEWISGQGVIDGDVLVISTKKYIAKAISSPDTTTILYYAIRYE